MKTYQSILSVLLLTSGTLSENTMEVTPINKYQDDQYKKLSWFIHITDIHISSWEDTSRQEQVIINLQESLQ